MRCVRSQAATDESSAARTCAASGPSLKTIFATGTAVATASGKASTSSRMCARDVVDIDVIDTPVVYQCHRVLETDIGAGHFGECPEPISNDSCRLRSQSLDRRCLSRVRIKSAYSSQPLHLLPEQFTLRECQSVFESMLRTELYTGSFRKCLAAAGLVDPIPGEFAREANRPAAPYRRLPDPEPGFFPGMLRGRRRAG